MQLTKGTNQEDRIHEDKTCLVVGPSTSSSQAMSDTKNVANESATESQSKLSLPPSGSSFASDDELIDFVASLPHITQAAAEAARELMPEQLPRDDSMVQLLLAGFQKKPSSPDTSPRAWDGSDMKFQRQVLLTSLDGGECLAKLVVQTASQSFAEIYRAARVITLLAALQGICVPELDRFVQFDVPCGELIGESEHICSDCAETKSFAKCDSNALVLFRSSSDTRPSSSKDYECKTCRESIAKDSTIRFCAMTIKKSGLEQSLLVFKQLLDIYHAPICGLRLIVQHHLQQKWEILQLYLRSNPWPKQYALQAESIFCFWKDLQSIKESRSIDMFFNDFGKWSIAFKATPKGSCRSHLENYLRYRRIPMLGSDSPKTLPEYLCAPAKKQYSDEIKLHEDACPCFMIPKFYVKDLYPGRDQ